MNSVNQNELLKKSLKRLLKRFKQNLSPQTRLSGSDWANKYFKLSAEDSEEQGLYSTDRFPPQKDIIDACCDPNNDEVTIMGSAQWGKTTVSKITIAEMIHQNPVPTLVVNPTLDMAETFSKDRFSPMIRDVEVLSSLVSDVKSRSSGNTIYRKSFPGGQITFAGSNSPASLAGRPIGKVIMEDLDRFSDSAGTEGDPDKLATKRTQAFSNALIIRNSTPTIKGASRISRAFNRTNKQFCYLPCPECGHYQKLEWERIKYLTDKNKDLIEDSIYYECENGECKHHIQEHDKYLMLHKYKWIAERPNARPGRIGFFINALYSPFTTWAKIIHEYLECRGNPEEFQVWWNTVLGRLWENRGDSPDWEKVFARREKYPFNIIPKGGSILLAGADVQDDRIEVEIRAYGPRMESWGVDYRILIGPTNKREVWEKLDKIMQEKFRYAIGGEAEIYRIAVDSGYETTQVYNFGRKWGPDKCMVVKGSSMRMAPLVRTPTLLDKDPRGKKLESGVYLWSVGTDIAKTGIYRAIKSKRLVEGEEIPFGFMHFPEHSENYFKQLTAEGLVIKRMKNGTTRFYWETPPGARNEVLDCNVYCRAAAAAIGVDRWTTEQHQKYIDIHVRKVSKQPARNPSRKKQPARKSSLFE